MRRQTCNHVNPDTWHSPKNRKHLKPGTPSRNLRNPPEDRMPVAFELKWQFSEPYNGGPESTALSFPPVVTYTQSKTIPRSKLRACGTCLIDWHIPGVWKVANFLSVSVLGLNIAALRPVALFHLFRGPFSQSHQLRLALGFAFILLRSRQLSFSQKLDLAGCPSSGPPPWPAVPLPSPARI